MNIKFSSWFARNQNHFLLALLLSIVFVVVYVLSPNHAQQKVSNENAAQLDQLSRNLKNHFESDYAGLNVKKAILEQLIPPGMLTATLNDVRNIWGTRVYISPVTLQNKNDAFKISYEEIPSYACIDISSNIPKGIIDFKINNRSVVALDKIDVEYASNICRRYERSNLEFIYQ